MQSPEQLAKRRQMVADFTAACDKSFTTLTNRLHDTAETYGALSAEEGRAAVCNAAVTALVRFMLDGEGTSTATIARVMLELRPVVEGAITIVKSEGEST